MYKYVSIYRWFSIYGQQQPNENKNIKKIY